MISVLSIATNVLVLAFILKRAKKSHINPYKHDVFTDQKDYIEALERLDDGEVLENA